MALTTVMYTVLLLFASSFSAISKPLSAMRSILCVPCGSVPDQPIESLIVAPGARPSGRPLSASAPSMANTHENVEAEAEPMLVIAPLIVIVSVVLGNEGVAMMVVARKSGCGGGTTVTVLDSASWLVALETVRETV